MLLLTLVVSCSCSAGHVQAHSPGHRLVCTLAYWALCGQVPTKATSWPQALPVRHKRDQAIGWTLESSLCVLVLQHGDNDTSLDVC